MPDKKIKVITFDLDDTLWSVRPVLLKAEQTVFDWLEAYAPKLTERFTVKSFMEWRWEKYQQFPDLKHQISQLRTKVMQLALEEAGYPPPTALELATQAFEVFIHERHQITPFDEAEPLLEALQDNYVLGVLTNGNADVFRMDIGRFFDFSFSAEQLNASKPSFEPFIAAQKHAKVSADEIVHIGDNIDHDINGALSAGSHAIWFNPKNSNATDALPDHSQELRQAKTLTEIPALIGDIQSAIYSRR